MTNETAESRTALGICLEDYDYPHPVRFFPLSNGLQPVSMAYRDIVPDKQYNGQTVVLFHGKAFGQPDAGVFTVKDEDNDR